MMGDLLRQYCLPVLVLSELAGSAKPLHEHHTMPPGVHEPSVNGVRSTKLVGPNGKSWINAATESLEAFTKLPGMSTESQVRKPAGRHQSQVPRGLGMGDIATAVARYYLVRVIRTAGHGRNDQETSAC